MMEHGGDVWRGGAPGQWLDFSANLRPEGTPAWALAAMEAALDEARYYPQRDLSLARSGLCAYTGAAPEMLLPTAGGVAAIDLICQQARRVFFLPPTFSEYALRARAHQKPALAFEGVLGRGDVLFLCNPNNPTGQALSREKVLSLKKRVSLQGGILAVDEAFIDYCPQHSVRGFVDEGLWVAGSLTKILAIPGARLGYLLADRDSVSQMAEKALPWALNAFAAAVARALPRHLEDLAQEARRNGRRRASLARALTQRGALVYPSQANFLMLDLGRPVPDLTGQGILLRDLTSFGLGGRYLRAAVRTEEENRRLVEALWQN